MSGHRPGFEPLYAWGTSRTFTLAALSKAGVCLILFSAMHQRYRAVVMDVCMQADQAAKCRVLVNQNCAALLANLFITLARKHSLQDEVKTVLTRGLYNLHDSLFVQFLAREICEKCLKAGFTKLPEDILQDVLEKRQPQEYVKNTEMGSSVAEFLSCASER